MPHFITADTFVFAPAVRVSAPEAFRPIGVNDASARLLAVGSIPDDSIRPVESLFSAKDGSARLLAMGSIPDDSIRPVGSLYSANDDSVRPLAGLPEDHVQPVTPGLFPPASDFLF